MRNYILAALLSVSALPALAAPQDWQKQKLEMLRDTRQETVAIGGGRFLIFSGMKAVYQYATSIDLVKLENGVPKFDPLFMEEYNPGTNSITLADGVGFSSLSYNYDKTTNMLDFTALDSPEGPKLQYKYKLDGDTLRLQEVWVQENDKTPPKALFKAS